MLGRFCTQMAGLALRQYPAEGTSCSHNPGNHLLHLELLLVGISFPAAPGISFPAVPGPPKIENEFSLRARLSLSLMCGYHDP